jgi:hypothetical protein
MLLPSRRSCGSSTKASGRASADTHPDLDDEAARTGDAFVGCFALAEALKVS